MKIQQDSEHEQLVSQLAQLTTRLKDQEQQIFLLQAQQRNVRFLAKQLAREIQLRLNKRAKRTVAPISLVYARDPAIERKLQDHTVSREELLVFIHYRDKANIHLKHRSVAAVFRPIPWKLAAGLFTAGIIVARRGARRIR